MRQINAFKCLLFIVALLSTTPKLVFGEDSHLIRFDARPGTEIQSTQLGEFTTKNLSVKFGTDMRPLSVRLRLELIERDEGVIVKYESESVEVKGGETYPGSRWIRASNNPAFSAPGFGERRKIGISALVRFPAADAFPDVCRDATHAMRITLVSEDGRLVKSGQPMGICLEAEG